MPAAELEIVDALVKNAQGGSALNVLLASSGDQQEDEAIVEALHGSKVTVVRHLIGLESAQEAAYDAILVNKVIVGDDIINEHAKLDVLIGSALKALKLGGVLIIREDLNGYLATEKVAGLTDFFDVYRVSSDSGTLGFEFHSLNQLNASIHSKQNFMDVFWTLRKKQFESASTNHGTVTFRDFLDKTQYTDTGIYAYEWIFGDDFISPGGAAENLKVLKRFGDMKSGQKMLDIGVGIGGGARQAATEFGIEALGMDLSSNMLSIGMDRLQRDKDTRMRYQIANALEYDFDAESFDYVFSRDCMQHNDNMAEMMNRIFKWLKPGGRVLITMYGKGRGEQTPKFKEYVAQRHYFLKSLDEMIQVTKDAGFENVQGTNMTERFKEILIEERTKTETRKEEFLQKFTEGKLKDLIDGWNDKLGYIEADNHNWIQIIADKPSH